MLTVIGLCEEFRAVLRFDRTVGRLPSVQLSFLLCNNHGLSRWHFGLRLLRSGIRSGGTGRLLMLLMGGRVRITIARLHDPKTLAYLRAAKPDVGLHGCDVIYRTTLFACFRLGVLNSHIGLLPRYRGRSVMEWSLLEGQPTGITAFFMDEGIDTGPHIVLRCEIPVHGCTSVAVAKAKLLSLDGVMFAEALVALSRPDFQPTLQQYGQGRRYYAMSALFREVVEAELAGSVPKTPDL